ncbi:hypothetical protein [Algoriphagus formosus]|uniref:hypothetical protein n=1 Tax=Algoriphagus formosus TaxID=2007308 RepID=UPI003F6F3F46
MENDKEYRDKWLKFLDPENLKDNLIFSSLFIASFEAFKDHIVEEVKSFFSTGFNEDGLIISENYSKSVGNLAKSKVKASLLWLKESGAIESQDLDIFNDLLLYRNKLAHELMDLLFEGLPQELPEKFTQLIKLKIKIEKWWIVNFEIPTNPDFDYKPEIKEEDIITPTQIFNQLIFDMLSGDEKRASYYKNEFKKVFKS